MASIKPKTYHAKEGDVERAWYVVDASGQTVGRLASRVAHVLRGKHKPQFTPSVDVGDNVIIINAEKIVFTGNKFLQKIYYRSTTRPGSLRAVDARTMQEKHPDRILEYAIQGMLPHTTLGRAMARKLHIYAGESHPHQAQNPQPLDVATLNVGMGASSS
jgi:large subunit ribosomal protein L13